MTTTDPSLLAALTQANRDKSRSDSRRALVLLFVFVPVGVVLAYLALWAAF
jgi:hypothetical protein